MFLFLDQVNQFLATPPGNLVYHLMVAFSIAGALQGAFHNLRVSGFPQARRMVTGLLILLGLQFLLYLGGALAALGLFAAGDVLPALDRAISLLSLVWIAWLWAFPEPLRLADAATLLLSLFGLALFGLTVLLGGRTTEAGFNYSMFEIIWQVLSLGVILLGVLVLVLRRPNGWGAGLTMFLLAGLGHAASLFWQVPGDYPGLVRLAHLAAFPILLTLPQRFPVSQAEKEVRKVTPSSGQASGKGGGKAAAAKSAELDKQERRRYSTDPKTFQSLITLAAETSPEKIPAYLVRGIAQAMLADLCFLISITSERGLAITCGYDLIREEILGSAEMDKNNVPLLASAVLRGRPLRLPASSTSSDLKGLGEVLGLASAGHLLAVPVASPERGPLGAVMILSPYSNRLWSAEDQTYLGNISSLLLPVLERGERIATLEAERDSARLEVKSAQEIAASQQAESETLARSAGQDAEKTALYQQQSVNLAALIIQYEDAQGLIAQLRAEMETLRKAEPPVSDERFEQMDQELRNALEEMAHKQNLLAEANARIMLLEDRPTSPITSDQVEVIASISQELRQPMSSIVGYTDLLLGESVGILGSLQRKFVERIKASTERIGSLADDLIQITNLDTGNMEFTPEAIDLNLIIDNAMAYTSTQIREKNITLRLDIADSPLQVRTDRDALQQVLIHLLQNATSVTQTEGTITLRVQLQENEGHNYVSIQVADTGGGIASEDVPRVFARRYRAEHSLIQGVGDTGVGLAIAKTLVEAQGGRIWVETEAGIGSTFTVVLEVQPVETEG